MKDNNKTRLKKFLTEVKAKKIIDDKILIGKEIKIKQELKKEEQETKKEEENIEEKKEKPGFLEQTDFSPSFETSHETAPVLKPERERARETIREQPRLEQVVETAPSTSKEKEKEDLAKYTGRYSVGDDGYFHAYEHDVKGWGEDQDTKELAERAHKHFERPRTRTIDFQDARAPIGFAEDGMVAKTRTSETVKYEMRDKEERHSAGLFPEFEKKYKKGKKV
jgi:hypothetical protein